MQEIAEVPQPVQQLKTQWVEQNTPEVDKAKNFNVDNWLTTFYDRVYLADRGQALDQEIVDMACEALGLVHNPKNQQEIIQVQALLKTQVSQQADQNATPLELRKLLKKSFTRLRTERKMEEILHSLEKEDYEVKGDKISRLGLPGEMKASVSLQETLKTAEQLPENIRELAATVREMKMTKEDLTDNLIESQIAIGDKDTERLYNQFSKTRNILQEAFASGSPAKIAEIISNNQELFQKFHNEKILHLINSLPQIAHLSRRQWKRFYSEEEGILSEACSLNSQRNIIIDDLVRRDVLDKDIETTLEAMTGIGSLSIRTSYLEQVSQDLNLSSDQRKALYADSMQDLADSKEVSLTLIEDILNGKITGEDLNGMIISDWLTNYLDPNLVKNLLPSERTEKVKQLLLKGVKIAVPIIITAFVLTQLQQCQAVIPNLPTVSFPGIPNTPSASPNTPGFPKLEFPKELQPYLPLLPLLPLLPFGPNLLGKWLNRGGGSSLNFENPFQGIEHNDNHKIYQIKGFKPTNEARYFRLKSSGKFNCDTSEWEDTNETKEFDIYTHGFKSDESYAGELHGRFAKRKKGFVYLPVPYGKEITRFAYSNTYDKRSDGSYGIDMDVKTRPDGEVHQSRDFHGNKDFEYKEGSYQNQRQQFPMEENTYLDPIITNLSALPKGVQDLVKELDMGNYSKKEEARKIIDFVRDTFTYSLDTKNKAIYDAARKQGRDYFLRAIFEFKKVKCDGAATAAISLLRSRGIASRLTVGYKVDPQAEYILGQNAHGWVEALIDDEVQVMDPTPTNIDETTMRVLNQSSFIDRIVSKLTANRWDGERFNDQTSTNNAVLNRIFRRTSPGLYKHLYLSYPYFDDRRTRKKAIQKALKDERILKSVEIEQEQRSMDVQELIQYAKEKGMEERTLRIQMLRENFRLMLKTATGHLFESIFDTRLPIDRAFAEKWHYDMDSSSTDNFYEYVGVRMEDDELKPLAKEIALGKRTLEIRDSQGEFTESFLEGTVDLLKECLYKSQDRRDFSDKREKREWKQDFAALKEKNLPLITLDLVRENKIPELIEAYIEAYKLLYQ